MPSCDFKMKVDSDCVHLEDFHLLKVLGKGAYGKVFQARKIRGSRNGQLFAIKSVNKSRIASSQTDIRHTKAERDVLVRTEHPFIVKLHFAFETNSRLYLVQEFCRGGELFRRMEVERMMLEDHARFYLCEIVCALEYLHGLDIIYRDLKTENVMLDEEGHVKLIDFGLSKLGMSEGALTNTFCGTVEYMAPEVVTRSPGYNKPADWWSFGIFTFDLLTGRSPFHSNRGKQETKERILRGKFHTPAFLTPQAQDLIRRLLRRPVERRLGSKDGATEVKNHDFFGATCWEKVLKKGYKPPFVPSFNGDDDVSNFDARFTSKSPRESDANNSNTVNDYWKRISRRNGISCIRKKNAKQTLNRFIKSRSQSTGRASNSEREDSHMFQDFDYISPEMSARFDSADEKKDPSTNILPDEMQELRIRGFGP